MFTRGLFILPDVWKRKFAGTRRNKKFNLYTSILRNMKRLWSYPEEKFNQNIESINRL